MNNANDLLKLLIKMLNIYYFLILKLQDTLAKCQSRLIACYTKTGVNEFGQGQDLHSLDINYGPGPFYILGKSHSLLT